MSKVTDRVVIWDPSGKVPEGELVDFAAAEVIRQAGGCSLPTIVEHIGRSGIGGYAVRKYGAGWPLDGNQARLQCPLTLLVPEGSYRGLHWAIRLQAAEALVGRAREGQPVTDGILRVVADNTQIYAQRGAATPLEAPITGAKLGPCDDHGGWTVTGRSTIGVPSAGHIGFGVYGMMPGLRVAWVAISLTPSH